MEPDEDGFFEVAATTRCRTALLTLSPLRGDGDPTLQGSAEVVAAAGDDIAEARKAIAVTIKAAWSTKPLRGSVTFCRSSHSKSAV